MGMSSHPVTAAELGGFALFHGLPAEERVTLAAAARWREPADGEVLYDEGGPATTMFLVERGQVTLGVQRDGRRVIVGTLGPGEVLNWSCLRDEPLSLTTARTAGSARLVAIPADALLALLQSGRPAGLTVMRRLFGVAAVHLDAARDQMLRLGREGVITAG
jgi:CRP-like cAMP-binding protein